MKRPTANVSGDSPGDSAPVADDERNQPFNHLGDAPPQVLSQDWFLQHRYLGNAPLLAITFAFCATASLASFTCRFAVAQNVLVIQTCASAGCTVINKG